MFIKIIVISTSELSRVHILISLIKYAVFMLNIKCALARKQWIRWWLSEKKLNIIFALNYVICANWTSAGSSIKTVGALTTNPTNEVMMTQGTLERLQEYFSCLIRCTLCLFVSDNCCHVCYRLNASLLWDLSSFSADIYVIGYSHDYNTV